MNRNGSLPRRKFLRSLAVALPASAAAGGLWAEHGPEATGVKAGKPSPAKEAAADLVIIGGGLGGCAAALAAARNGLRVIMTEETDWIGGQLAAELSGAAQRPGRAAGMELKGKG